MLQFQSLTNKKNTKTYSEALVIAGPTPGELKLTPLGAEKLGVKEGDNVAVVVADSKVYLGKGINGIPVLDDNGNQVKTATGKKVHKPNTSFGATLGGQDNSVLLKCSAQAAWDTLGGKTTANITFTIDEPVEGQVLTGNKDDSGEDSFHITQFFGLTYKETKDKAPRKEKEDTQEISVNTESGNTQKENTNEPETEFTEPTTLEKDFEDEEV